MIKSPNRLIHESSPYLLQHAHNPVNWFPWGDEALGIARAENKPILVSIGYAACHWCHVMEHESFEDVQTALLMNEHFVCIKIDREERPDLDHFFMDALQAISGNGGWPLNMFLTSEAKPFYGGTYFPPNPIHNRISWKELLLKIHSAYQLRKDEVELQAAELLRHLSHANQLAPKQTTGFVIPNTELFSSIQTDQIFQNLMKAADRDLGGFGAAPKFPQSFSIQYLLRYAHYTGNSEALAHAEFSLQAMMRGGIYDQIGGGFCRYSTDANWLAPHFEKMAYDNALLLIVLAEAFQITRNPAYATVIEETIGFLKREMLSDEGGFFAALDADSEGEEGKFYTWHIQEVRDLLKEDAAWVCEVLDITENGNWEHVNIPRLLHDLSERSALKGINAVDAMAALPNVKKTLLEARSKRVRPATDDKIILGWNALINQGLVAAYQATGQVEWLRLSEKNMDFMLTVFRANGNQWLHTHKAGVSKFPAFLDDLAMLVQSMILLQEVNGNLTLLEEAHEIMQYILQFFTDEDGLFFYFTPDFHTEVPVRKKDQYDGAMPSSNAVMAWNLHKLGLFFNIPDWVRRSALMLEANREGAVKYPTSFGVWCNLLLEKVIGTHEILVLGSDSFRQSQDLLKNYIPNRVLIQAENVSDRFPIMHGRVVGEDGETRIYICKEYACRLPASNVDDALAQLLTK
ncbi:MAG: hypothetical protein RL766_280 [Bacteroidota bacterium]